MNSTIKHCPHCKEKLPPYEVEICPACGRKIPHADVPPPLPPPVKPTPPPVKPGPPVNPGLHYGGFWIRLVAAIIDCVAVQILVLPVFIALRVGLEFVADAIKYGGAGEIAMMQDTVLLIIGYAIYEAVLESSASQATLGKRLFDLRVTNLDGNRISFARALGRHFAKYISSVTLLIGYIIAGFSARKQTLHDMIAGTVVRRA